MVHLHIHSHFSFGTGVSSPEVLVAAAAERGHRTLACTDSNGIYGAVEFQRACEAAGVRPILGAHLVTDHEETVALAIDERGWAALCRAVSAIHWAEVEWNIVSLTPSAVRGKAAMPGNDPLRCAQGDKGRRLLSSQLAFDRDGLILLSRDVAFLERIAAASGTCDLYAELIPGKERHAVLAAARRLGIPSAATNAVVMAHPEDWARHRLLRAIHLNTTLSELDGGRAVGRSGGLNESTARPPNRPTARDAWLRPADDIVRLFPDCPEAVRETEIIAERCRYRIPIGRIVAPRLAEPDESFARLRALAYDGAERRYGTVAPSHPRAAGARAPPSSARRASPTTSWS